MILAFDSRTREKPGLLGVELLELANRIIAIAYLILWKC